MQRATVKTRKSPSQIILMFCYELHFSTQRTSNRVQWPKDVVCVVSDSLAGHCRLIECFSGAVAPRNGSAATMRRGDEL